MFLTLLLMFSSSQTLLMKTGLICLSILFTVGISFTPVSMDTSLGRFTTVIFRSVLPLWWQCGALSSIFHLRLMLTLFDSSSQCMNSQRGWMSSVTRQLCQQYSCQQNSAMKFVQLCECFFSVILRSSLRRQTWTCCPSPLMIHPINTIATILILHLFLRASTRLSVALPPLLSSHLYLPSSTMTCGAMTCPLPLLKTLKRRMSLNVNDLPATEGLCECVFCYIDQLKECYAKSKVMLNIQAYRVGSTVLIKENSSSRQTLLVVTEHLTALGFSPTCLFYYLEQVFFFRHLAWCLLCKQG